MFTGIIEATSQIQSFESRSEALTIIIQRPEHFTDLKLGDSVAVNGVCLTVEALTETTITFTLGAETLKVLQWQKNPWTQHSLNLERSLRWGDRIHGHLVSGHVDTMGEVVASFAQGESWILQVQIPLDQPLIWKKGSITLQGVSLTVNEVKKVSAGVVVVEVCLIPETLKRTNLQELSISAPIAVEYDWMAKALTQAFQEKIQNQLSEMRNL